MAMLRVGALAFAFRSVIFKTSRCGPICSNFVTIPPPPTVGAKSTYGDGYATTDHRKSTPVIPGTVYFVSTPIGNLDDITYRGMKILQSVDVIAAEDTRRTGLLLHLLGIETKAVKEKKGISGGPSLLSHHEHNHKRRIPDIISLVRAGKSVAVVSDAGTPGISDPGMELADTCAKEGVPLVPIPGVCAAVAAISVSGFFSNEFLFLGFLPRKGSELKRKLDEIASLDKTCVFYEAPHRVQKTFKLLADLIPCRNVLIAREITKLHEELFRGTASDARVWFEEHPPKGEFTVVISSTSTVDLSHGLGQERVNDQGVDDQKKLQDALDAVLDLLQQSQSGGDPWSMSMAVQKVSKDYKIPKRLLYKLSLERQHKETDSEVEAPHD